MGRKKSGVTLYLIAIFVVITSVAFILGLLAGEKLAPIRVVKEVEFKTVNITRVVKTEAPIDKNEVYLKLPAVDRTGEGVLADLSVIIRKGEGYILVDINDVLADFDTQLSARIASQVASEYTGLMIDDLDIIYKINTDSPLISGTSAGAAMSLATIAALENRTPNPDVLMTGTISPDGSVGRVGGIIAKAEAAERAGLTTFLVPPLQSKGVMYKEERKCVERLGFRQCSVNYLPISIDVGERVGIDVVEIDNVAEAAQYFFS